MNYADTCTELKQLLIRLERELPAVSNPGLTVELSTLRNDIDADFYTVVVLGEFKRGKSTLVNALIGEDLLPTDVTPTTATINVLMYRDERLLRVHRPDGTAEVRDLSSRCLQEFVAADGFDAASVQYLEIGISSPILRDRVVIVDTPGVADLNQQRADITYRFIPRADAVIFLLDATAPVRKSEKEFLESCVLSSGIEHIVFVAGFADMVDSEELASLAELIRRRIAGAVGIANPQIFLVAARRALENRVAGAGQDTECPDLGGLLAWLEQSRAQGPRSRAKLQRFFQRSESILKRADAEASKSGEVMRLTDEALEGHLGAMHDFTARSDRRRERMNDWLQDRRNEVRAIVSKALDHFSKELREEIVEMVACFKGAEFKEFIQDRIPVHVKKRCKNWVESHSPPITALLQQIDQQISSGLSQEFQVVVNSLHIPGASGGEVRNVGSLQISADDISSSAMVAGLITGGAAALLMVLGGPIFLPLLSMAGYPFLQKSMLDSNLSEAKQKVAPLLRQALDATLDELSRGVLMKVEKDIDAIAQNAEGRFAALLTEEEQRITVEMRARQEQRSDLTDRAGSLRQFRDRVAEIKKDFEALDGCPEEVVVG